MKKQLLATALISTLMAAPAMAKEKKEMASETAWGLGTGATLGAVVGGPIGAFAGAFIGGIIGEKEAAENTVESQQVMLSQYKDTDQQLRSTLDRNRSLTAQIDALENEQNRLEQARIDNLLAMTVQFRSGSSRIEPHFAEQLDQLALILKRKPELSLNLNGYADVQGDESANLSLSQRRADAVQAYLVDQGVSGEQLYAQGYGEQKLVDNGNEYETNFFDRRVTLTARGATQSQMAKN
ncbi:sortase-associated OmpA-like protein PdsO [Pseudoalteromonas sp. MM17-2]|uniref:sortase-associated OmpA-like protein PdsO n=1 Tax=Pseudoalteromonas sp. MM17-2 TaxID=2917753 RepID=UPI001EF6FCC5|nr:sortase-associated OmpA-like protein PdsO [Pseudoalteromonas sp. MM17-2]MCG7543521.1 sortase-associated OmpA-like protein PdsO [Pseudoalteromonas sp. MM17-2]